MSLVHIRSAVNDEDVYCGHPGPDLWNYGEEEASCADCIKLYLQERIEQHLDVLRSFVMNRNSVPGSSALWVVTDNDMTKAEVLLGMLERKKS